MKKRLINYTRAIVIVHGASEMQIVNYIKSKLHLNIKIHANENGSRSILISGLNRELKKKYFINPNAFKNEFMVEQKGKQLANFKLFIIMDKDESDVKIARGYTDKSMFKGHWLYDYIIPILNDQALEDPLLEVGIISSIPCNKEKLSTYYRIFPTVCDKLGYDSVKAIEDLDMKLRKSSKTNLYELTEYCLQIAKETLIK
jgi:hypothetical protein